MKPRRVLARARLVLALGLVLEAFLFSVGLGLFAFAVFPKINIYLLIFTFLCALGYLLASRQALSDIRVAWRVERANPALREALVSWVELRGEGGGRTLEELARRISATKIKLPRPKVRALVMAAFFLGADLLMLRFLITPGAFMDLPPKAGEIVLPASAVFSDERFWVRVLTGEKARLVLAGQTTLSYPVSGDAKVELGPLPPGRWRVLLTAGEDTLDSEAIRAISRPGVLGVRVWVREPDYVGGRRKTYENPTEISVPEGSEVKIEVRHDGDTCLAPRELVAERDTLIRFKLAKGGLWCISPRTLSIRVIPDLPPEVKILEPKGDVNLPASGRLGVVVAAQDEFGLREVRLLWEFKGQYQGAKRPCRGKLVVRDTLVADLSRLGLLPGQEAVVWAEAVDGAGQVAKTPPIRVRFPRTEELLTSLGELGQEGSRGTQSLSARAEDLSQRLRALEEDIKAERRLTWSEKERILSEIQRSQELLGELEAELSSAEREAERLLEAAQLDPELVSLALRVHQLLEEAMTPELEKALEELQRALETLNRDEVLRALENLRITTEELKENLRAAAELLERYSQEARLLALAERADSLAEAMEEAAEKASYGNVEAAAETGKQLAREAGELAEELGEEAPRELGEALDALRTAVSKAEVSRREASAGNPRGAKQAALEAAREARAAAGKLRAAYGSLVQRRREQNALSLRRAWEAAAFLGEEAEKTARLARRRPDEALARLEAIGRGARVVLDSLKALRARTLGIPKDAVAMLKTAVRMTELASRSGDPAWAAARVQENLNLAALRLMEAQGSMSSCQGGSTGLEAIMRSLAEMAQAQAQLNQETGSLFPVGASRQRLLALAAQQEALRRQLEGLRRAIQNQGGLRGLEGALKGAEEDMKAVERDLREGRLTQETLRRQSRILTRLLEAQSSIREREFQRKREAQTAKPFARPKGPRSRELERQRAILQELRELSESPYPPEYRALIRAYLRALLGEVSP